FSSLRTIDRRLAVPGAGRPDVLRCVRDERQVTGPLDGLRQRPLMLRAGVCLPPRVDPAAVGDETAQKADVLIVDNLDLIGAHDADAAAPSETARLSIVATGASCLAAPTVNPWRPANRRLFGGVRDRAGLDVVFRFAHPPLPVLLKRDVFRFQFR